MNRIKLIPTRKDATPRGQKATYKVSHWKEYTMVSWRADQFGEEEWKTRTHGKDKRCTWRKLHIAIDHKTHEIIAVNLTTSTIHDSQDTNSLLNQMDKLNSVTGDRGYDNKNI